MQIWFSNKEYPVPHKRQTGSENTISLSFSFIKISQPLSKKRPHGRHEPENDIDYDFKYLLMAIRLLITPIPTPIINRIPVIPARLLIK